MAAYRTKEKYRSDVLGQMTDPEGGRVITCRFYGGDGAFLTSTNAQVGAPFAVNDTFDLCTLNPGEFVADWLIWVRVVTGVAATTINVGFTGGDVDCFGALVPVTAVGLFGKGLVPAGTTAGVGHGAATIADYSETTAKTITMVHVAGAAGLTSAVEIFFTFRVINMFKVLPGLGLTQAAV